MSFGAGQSPLTNSPIAAAARPALLLLAAVVALGTALDRRTSIGITLVIVLWLIGRLRPVAPRGTWLLLIGELVIEIGGVIVLGGEVDPLLICLTSTVLAMGLIGGYRPVVLATGAVAAALTAFGLLHAWGETDTARDFTQSATQWVAIAFVMGMLGGRIKGLTGAGGGQEDRYAQAYRLLAQLRTVSEDLPGSLDPGSVAHTLLADCLTVADCEYGAVFLQVGGDQLVPMALHGYQRVPWRASLSEGGPIQRAWLTGAVVIDRRQPDPQGLRRGSILLVLPMTVDQRRVGLVALEWRSTAELPAARTAALASVVEQCAVPMETAALFDELRMSAAAEERSRLAREMHDGIAQDLAYLGYEVDALVKALKNAATPASVDQALALRQHITEFMGELRLSITDLRSSIGPGRGLGAALSEYARSVGTSTGMTVHLSLTEGSTRLSADAEVQLLRIAHEAINRARRRPGAQNLWVTLSADPPAARLIIEDDGRNDGVALYDEDLGGQFMDERARRLGARLTMTPRMPSGTKVSVMLTGVAHEHDRTAR